MSSKLDELRNQFRERLAVRSVTTSKCDVKRDYNQNIENKFDLRQVNKPNDVSNTSRKLTTSTKSLPKLETKTTTLLSKVETRKPNALPLPSNCSSKTTVKKETNDGKVGRTGGLRSGIANRAETQIHSKRESKPSLKSRFGGTSATERSLAKGKSEGMPCSHCGRSFSLTERLQRHESVCGQSSNKSRQRFDSMEQRFKGLPKEYLHSYESHRNDDSDVKAVASTWRQKHEYCIAAIRAAKGEPISGDIPTTAEIRASIRQQCNYCKRRFNDDALRRHLPICAKLYHKNATSMNF